MDKGGRGARRLRGAFRLLQADEEVADEDRRDPARGCGALAICGLLRLPVRARVHGGEMVYVRVDEVYHEALGA